MTFVKIVTDYFSLKNNWKFSKFDRGRVRGDGLSPFPRYPIHLLPTLFCLFFERDAVFSFSSSFFFLSLTSRKV